MLYQVARPLLFQLDPETAHVASMQALKLAHRTGLKRLLVKSVKPKPVQVMGLNFPNPLGLAAGLDKHAEYVDALGSLGFGFLEIGGVTPRPQPGNPRPRVFRLPEQEAIINRFGFNSVGIERFVENLKSSTYRGVLGVNLGKNKETPLDRAVDDYLIGLEKIYSHVHFATINVSSPNTPNLRQLQSAGELGPLLGTMHRRREELSQRHGRRVALALKIAPDLSDAEIDVMARTAADQKMDAIIATNTTLSRDRVRGLPHGNEEGGLSGAPLREVSTEVIRKLARALDGALPIIGVGGIMEAQHAKDKLAAGATLLQLYCGLVYRGPDVVADIVNGL
jgi:dihydroorotate dehydrogenase